MSSFNIVTIFFVYTLLFFEVCLTINLNKGKKFTFLMNFVVKPEVKKDEKWLPLKGSEKTNISLSDRTKPWFRFWFRRNPKVSVSTETQFQPKPKPKPKFL